MCPMIFMNTGELYYFHAKQNCFVYFVFWGGNTDMVTQFIENCLTLLLHRNIDICIIIPSTRIPCGVASKLYCKITSLRLQTESQ